MVETLQGGSILGRFQYDFEGRRNKKIGEDGVRQCVYDQTSTFLEYDDTGAQVAKYDYGSDRQISLLRRDEPRRFFGLDGLRSVTSLTDDAGAVAARYHLDAWGNFRFPAELTASKNRFAFTGYEWDPETGLFNAKARYFDPQLGRFLSQDGFLGQVDDPPSLHRYFYAADNPLAFVDPDGNESVRQTWGIDEPQGFWSAFGKNVAYNAWNMASFGTLGRQDKLVEQYEAGKITEAQYWGRTAINAGSAAAIGVAAAMSGGVAAAGAGALGAGTFATGAIAGAAANIGAQATTDLLEVGLLETKRASDIRGIDYAVAGVLGAVVGGGFAHAANQAPKATTLVESAPPPKTGPVIDLVRNAEGKYAATFDESVRLPRVAGGSQGDGAGVVEAPVLTPTGGVARAGAAIETPAPGPVTLMDPPGNFVANASKRGDIDPGGVLDVLGHGTPTSIQLGSTLINHRTLARLLRGRPEFVGQDIRLLACETGQCSRGLAQNLANKLGVTIIAPDELVWAYPSGKLVVAKGRWVGQQFVPDLSRPGKFVTFLPGKPAP
jgi:RHS repeat-associated protein